MANIPVELQSAASVEIPTPQTREMAAAISQFLAEKQTSKPEPSDAAAAAAEAAQPEIPINDDFNIRLPNEKLMDEALVSTENVEVTMEDKQIFLKAILADQPVRLTIVLFNGAMRFEFKTRTVYTQRRIYDLIDHAVTKGDIIKKHQDDNIAGECIDLLQKLCAVLMIERINGKLFSDIELLPAAETGVVRTIEEDYIQCKTLIEQRLKKSNMVYWSALLNAMLIFENKIQKLNSQANNPSFWQPLS